MEKEEYRCFLYKQVNGQTESHIFTGQTAVDEALKEGWHTTFADFVDDVENLDDSQKAAIKDVCSIAAGDANILANADQIKDIDKLKEAFERVQGKPIDKRIKSIAGVRNAIKKALGESNVN